MFVIGPGTDRGVNHHIGQVVAIAAAAGLLTLFANLAFSGESAAGLSGAILGTGGGLVALLANRSNRARRAASDEDRPEQSMRLQLRWVLRGAQSGSIEHHLVVQAAARAFFFLLTIGFAYGLAEILFDAPRPSMWLVWAFAWMSFGMSMSLTTRDR
jgi:hypothetical protein